MCVFFFKQKTAYEMRISDWSSDVCSSDLEADTLTIDGEFAAGLSVGADHLVLRVLALLRERHGADRVPPIAVRLTQAPPGAAGIGGGSAHAAAVAHVVRREFLPDLGDAAVARQGGGSGTGVSVPGAPGGSEFDK